MKRVRKIEFFFRIEVKIPFVIHGFSLIFVVYNLVVFKARVYQTFVKYKRRNCQMQSQNFQIVMDCCYKQFREGVIQLNTKGIWAKIFLISIVWYGIHTSVSSFELSNVT